jgi:poly(3-hydroxybutyrate) depolymerase
MNRQGSWPARAAVPALFLALLLPWPSRADEVVLRSGRTLEGRAIRQGDEVLLNEYGCSLPEMTLGVTRLRATDVREIRPRPLQDDLRRRWEELAPGDVARRLDLLREARDERLAVEARRLAEEILVLAPQDAEALRVVGSREAWEARRRGDPALDPALALELRRLLRLESGRARREAAERLARERGFAASADGVERMARSLALPRGLQEEVRLRLEAEAFPDGRYALYVPPGYDPLVPRPLLLALHGGGIMAEKGASVRGSPRDALAFYLDGARERGWILVCPRAVEAPWTAPRNRAFVDAVLDEVAHLYNVDLDRVHLAGQGGGGDGVWSLAARAGERFATVSAVAAGKPQGVSAAAGRSAIWIYHGEADEVVPVEPVRKAAAGLLRQKADFAYCELPREGHGFPAAARREYFHFAGPRRRRRAASAWPASSFSVPSTKGARDAFGDPAWAWEAGLPAGASDEDLLRYLQAGGFAAEPAARGLLEGHGTPSAELARAVHGLVGDGKAPAAARRWGAWLCGAWRDEAAVDALGSVLRTAEDPLLLRAAAEAVGAIASPRSAQDLRWALVDLSRRYKALPVDGIPFHDAERSFALATAVADAIGRVGRSGDDGSVFLALEEHLVRGLLMDARPLRANAARGDDASALRARLAVALANAYRRLGAEATLYDMLRVAVRADASAREVLERALRDPPR